MGGSGWGTEGWGQGQRARAGLWPKMQVFIRTAILPTLCPGALVAAGCRQQGLMGLLVFQQEAVAKGGWKCAVAWVRLLSQEIRAKLADSTSKGRMWRAPVVVGPSPWFHPAGAPRSSEWFDLPLSGAHRPEWVSYPLPQWYGPTASSCLALPLPAPTVVRPGLHQGPALCGYPPGAEGALQAWPPEPLFPSRGLCSLST